MKTPLEFAMSKNVIIPFPFHLEQTYVTVRIHLLYLAISSTTFHWIPSLDIHFQDPFNPFPAEGKTLPAKTHLVGIHVQQALPNVSGLKMFSCSGENGKLDLQ